MENNVETLMNFDQEAGKVQDPLVCEVWHKMRFRANIKAHAASRGFCPLISVHTYESAGSQ